MATVPEAATLPSQTPQPGGVPTVHVDMPQTIAGTIGKALDVTGDTAQKLGDAYAQHALQLAGLNNKAMADDANQKFLQEAAQENDAYRIKSQEVNPANAQQLLADHTAKIEAIRQKYRGGLNNLMSQSLYDDDSRRAASMLILNASTATAEGEFKYRNGVHNGNIKLYTQQATAAPDDASREAAMDNIRAETVRYRKEELGGSDVEAKADMLTAESAAYGDVIRSKMIADPVGMNDLYNRKVASGEISGPEQAELGPKLAELVGRHNTAADNDQILNGPGADGTTGGDSGGVAGTGIAPGQTFKSGPPGSHILVPEGAPSKDAIMDTEDRNAGAGAASRFAAKGWSPAAAAGIAANEYSESGVNPNPKGYNDGGAAYGAFQFHDAYQRAFLQHMGRPLQGSTIEQQEEFIHWDLTQGPDKAVGDRLRAAKTPEEAAQIFMAGFERPKDMGGQAVTDRQAIARQIAGGPAQAPPRTQGPAQPPIQYTGPRPAANAPVGQQLDWLDSNDAALMADAKATAARRAQAQNQDVYTAEHDAELDMRSRIEMLRQPWEREQNNTISMLYGEISGGVNGVPITSVEQLKQIPGAYDAFMSLQGKQRSAVEGVINVQLHKSSEEQKNQIEGWKYSDPAKYAGADKIIQDPKTPLDPVTRSKMMEDWQEWKYNIKKQSEFSNIKTQLIDNNRLITQPLTQAGIIDPRSGRAETPQQQRDYDVFTGRMFQEIEKWSQMHPKQHIGQTDVANIAAQILPGIMRPTTMGIDPTRHGFGLTWPGAPEPSYGKVVTESDYNSVRQYLMDTNGGRIPADWEVGEQLEKLYGPQYGLTRGR